MLFMVRVIDKAMVMAMISIILTMKSMALQTYQKEIGEEECGILWGERKRERGRVIGGHVGVEDLGFIVGLTGEFDAGKVAKGGGSLGCAAWSVFES